MNQEQADAFIPEEEAEDVDSDAVSQLAPTPADMESKKSYLSDIYGTGFAYSRFSQIALTVGQVTTLLLFVVSLFCYFMVLLPISVDLVFVQLPKEPMKFLSSFWGVFVVVPATLMTDFAAFIAFSRLKRLGYSHEVSKKRSFFRGFKI